MSKSRRTCPKISQNNLICYSCGKTFSYCPEGVAFLGQHACKEHSMYKIGHFMNRKTRYEDCCEPVGVPCADDAKTNDTQLQHDNCLDLYKTTIESWHDGPTEVRCCACGHVGPPYIRKRKNKVSSTRVGHYLLMACWPLFFAPMTAKNEITLYCKKCGTLFGFYDVNNGVLCQSRPSSKVSFEESDCNECC